MTQGLSKRHTYVSIDKDCKLGYAQPASQAKRDGDVFTKRVVDYVETQPLLFPSTCKKGPPRFACEAAQPYPSLGMCRGLGNT